MWRIDRRAAPGPDSLAAKLRRLEAERANRLLVEAVGLTFPRDKTQRQVEGREQAKRKAVARAAIQFLEVHLGDRFVEFAAFFKDAGSKSEHV